MKPLDWVETWHGANEDIPTWQGIGIMGYRAHVSFAGDLKLDSHADAPADALIARKAFAQASYERRVLLAFDHALTTHSSAPAFWRVGVWGDGSTPEGMRMIFCDAMETAIAGPLPWPTAMAVVDAHNEALSGSGRIHADAKSNGAQP